MDEQVPLAVTAGIGVVLVLTGAMVSAVGRRAADGRLGLNHVVGIRTSATLSSDEAWRVGHAAARGLSDASGAVFALTGLAAVPARPAPLFATVVLGGTVVATGLLLAAAVRAGRAVAERGTRR